MVAVNERQPFFLFCFLLRFAAPLQLFYCYCTALATHCGLNRDSVLIRMPLSQLNMCKRPCQMSFFEFFRFISNIHVRMKTGQAGKLKI